MSIPTPSLVDEAIYDEMKAHGGKIKVRDLYDPITRQFPQLTADDLRRRTPSGTNWWHGYIRFALDRLRKKGDVINLSRGVWAIKTQVLETSQASIRSPLARAENESHSLEIALAGGRRINLAVPAEVTKADVERICRVLNSLVQS